MCMRVVLLQVVGQLVLRRMMHVRCVPKSTSLSKRRNMKMSCMRMRECRLRVRIQATLTIATPPSISSFRPFLRGRFGCMALVTVILANVILVPAARTGALNTFLALSVVEAGRIFIFFTVRPAKACQMTVATICGRRCHLRGTASRHSTHGCCQIP